MALIDPYEQNSGGLIDPFETQAEQPAPEKGFFTRVGEDIGKRWQNIKDIDAPTTGLASLWATGEVAGLGADFIGQGLKSAYRTITPQATQDMFAEGAKNIGEYYAKPISAVSEGYNELKSKYPNMVRSGEAIANIGQFIPLAKGAQLAGKEALNIAKDVVSAVGKTAEQQIDNAIRLGVEKSVRPTVVGKHNSTQIKQYYDKATNAVRNIVNNRNNLALTNADGTIIKGELPKSLNQFSEAIDQTKKSIFQQYDDLAKKAGEEGATVSLRPVARELSRVASDPVMNDLYPNVASYIAQRATTLAERGVYSAEQAQEAIKLLNKSLEAFYKNPSFETASRASVDAMVVNNLRNGLDAVIEKATGAGYQQLKNAYGSLKTIEKEVAHRAIVDARKSVKGLLDFTDIFTGGELLAGIATMSPAMMVKAGAQKAIKEYFKRINNPNYIVKSMFNDVDDILKREAAGFKSASFRGAERRLPENPLGKTDMPPVPPGSYYSKKTSLPSTEVKGGRVKGEPYGAERMKINRQKGLPPGQGFSLSGEPYTPDVIDAIFTSRSRPISEAVFVKPERPALDMTRKDNVLSLPGGQGFTLGGENVKLKGLRNYQKALKKKIID